LARIKLLNERAGAGGEVASPEDVPLIGGAVAKSIDCGGVSDWNPVAVDPKTVVYEDSWRSAKAPVRSFAFALSLNLPALVKTTTNLAE
jgi:hypothetical protein